MQGRRIGSAIICPRVRDVQHTVPGATVVRCQDDSCKAEVYLSPTGKETLDRNPGRFAILCAHCQQRYQFDQANIAPGAQEEIGDTIKQIRRELGAG